MTKSPQKYWFKRRRFGLGWIPVTWQGWVTMLGGLGIIFFTAFSTSRGSKNVGPLLLIVFAVVILFIVIAYLKGPRPRWRWGQRPSDNHDEDF
jgi:FtsH-binding integral membrane protein